jgi:hypothetical protein
VKGGNDENPNECEGWLHADLPAEPLLRSRRLMRTASRVHLKPLDSIGPRDGPRGPIASSQMIGDVVTRVLDLGSGDGRLLTLVGLVHPDPRAHGFCHSRTVATARSAALRDARSTNRW